MTALLHIDASARMERSITRDLSARFVTTWREARPDDRIIRRDLSTDPPPFVTETWIAAAFTPRENRTEAQRAALAVSDKLISELRAADVIVLGAPMYNYGMPAVLKAWVDQVVRVNETFSFDLTRGDWPLAPMLGGKVLVTATSHGEFGFAGGVRAQMNHLDPHIDTLAHYFGVSARHRIAVEYQEFGDERHDRSREQAAAQATALALSLADAA